MTDFEENSHGEGSMAAAWRVVMNWISPTSSCVETYHKKKKAGVMSDVAK